MGQISSNILGVAEQKYKLDENNEREVAPCYNCGLFNQRGASLQIMWWWCWCSAQNKR